MEGRGTVPPALMADVDVLGKSLERGSIKAKDMAARIRGF